MWRNLVENLCCWCKSFWWWFIAMIVCIRLEDLYGTTLAIIAFVTMIGAPFVVHRIMFGRMAWSGGDCLGKWASHLKGWPWIRVELLIDRIDERGGLSRWARAILDQAKGSPYGSGPIAVVTSGPVLAGEFRGRIRKYWRGCIEVYIPLGAPSLGEAQRALQAAPFGMSAIHVHQEMKSTEEVVKDLAAKGVSSYWRSVSIRCHEGDLRHAEHWQQAIQDMKG